MHAPPPASRIPPLPQDHRQTHAAQSRLASHRRQLCHPQDPGGKALARAAFALSPALHAHFRLVVEPFFAEITRKRIRRGVFKSVDELKQAIMDYLDKHNDQPKPKSGPRLPSKSSLKSPVRNKRWNHNTSLRRKCFDQSNQI